MKQISKKRSKPNDQYKNTPIIEFKVDGNAIIYDYFTVLSMLSFDSNNEYILKIHSEDNFDTNMSGHFKYDNIKVHLKMFLGKGYHFIEIKTNNHNYLDLFSEIWDGKALPAIDLYGNNSQQWSNCERRLTFLKKYDSILNKSHDINHSIIASKTSYKRQKCDYKDQDFMPKMQKEPLSKFDIDNNLLDKGDSAILIQKDLQCQVEKSNSDDLDQKNNPKINKLPEASHQNVESSSSYDSYDSYVSGDSQGLDSVNYSNCANYGGGIHLDESSDRGNSNQNTIEYLRQAQDSTIRLNPKIITLTIQDQLQYKLEGLDQLINQDKCSLHIKSACNHEYIKHMIYGLFPLSSLVSITHNIKNVIIDDNVTEIMNNMQFKMSLIGTSDYWD